MLPSYPESEGLVDQAFSLLAKLKASAPDAEVLLLITVDAAATKEYKVHGFP